MVSLIIMAAAGCAAAVVVAFACGALCAQGPARLLRSWRRIAPQLRGHANRVGERHLRQLLT
jgi:hypothetical protein